MSPNTTLTSLATTTENNGAGTLCSPDEIREEDGLDSSTTTLPNPNSTHKKWTQVQDVSRLVLRALGFNLIVHACGSLRHVTGKGLHEPVKIAIRKDRVIALLRSLIHIIPISVALCEIILNWNTYYVGVSIYNQAVYQIVAKTHELAIQASLATILYSYIRYEMTVGNGIPFGALFSGLQISQISYMWSMEFWGSVRTAHLPLRRKAGLLAIIILSIVLASLSGPSSAVLLVPRLDFWQAGSTDIWINATSEDVYPTLLNGSQVPDNCSFSQEGLPSNGCPSSEWEKIQQYLDLTTHSVPQEYLQTYRYKIGTDEMELYGKVSQRQLYIGQDLINDVHVNPLLSSTQHVAVADALTTTGALWYMGLTNITVTSGHGSPLYDQSDAIHTLSGESYQPLSLAICVPDIIRDANDSRPVAFPLLYTANDPSNWNANITLSDNSSVPAILYSDISRAEIASTAGSLSQYRLRWVQLPQESFNGSSIGAIILLPQSSSNSSSSTRLTQDILLCNIAAGWGTTTLQMHTSGGSTSSITSKITSNESIPGVTNPKNIFLNTDFTEDTNWELSWHYPEYPQRPINVTRDWAQYLNPTVKSLNTSVFDLMMQRCLVMQGPELLPFIAAQIGSTLAAMMANGLARISFESTLQGSPRSIVSRDNTSWIDGNYWLSGKGNVFKVDLDESKDWVKLHVNSTVQGYGYGTENTSSRVAIAILTTYCILASAHLLYSGISGVSSTCWDSIAEVTALAMNSNPTAALRNTCAGITELHIFQLPVRILTFRDAEGDGEHLELVFGNADEEPTNLIKANRTYGTMPPSKKHGE